MREGDHDEFMALLDAAFDLIGKTAQAKIVSPTSKALFFQALAEYPLPLVRSAISQHIQVGKFTPTPADLIGYIEAAAGTDNRPGAEEAWALGLSTLDDTKTVVWTQEAAEAFGKAQPVLESSGPITARKTFLEVYDRLVAANRKQRTPVTWFASPGTDQTQRQLAMKAAVRAGQLAAPALLELAHTASASPPPAPTLRPAEQLAAIKGMLMDGIAAKQRAADAAITARIEEEDDFKRDLAKRVRQREAYIRMADQAQVRRAEHDAVREASDEQNPRASA